MSYPKTVTFKTLGCRLNQAEMDAVAMRLRARGLEILPFGEPADLTVINTCTVTQDADRDSRYAIRQAIRKSPRGRIVVTGCYAQMRPEAVRAIDGVDLVLDNSEKHRLVDYLELPQSEKFEKPVWRDEVSRTRALLKIQDGCDYHCSFCIIPFARGRARSLAFNNLIREAEDLVAQGFKEIVLTGVNIGTYCSEENGKPRRFVDLVDRLQEIEGLARLRISSIEPNTVTASLLRLMGRSSVICPHLHIPIQSASDDILFAMRRKYRKAKLQRLMDRIRQKVPEAGIGTDVIVGFPGETEAYFQETVSFLETSGFSYVHVFPFSAREGTPASKMRDRIPEEVVRKRTKILRNLSMKLRAGFARDFLGKQMPVLFEEPRKLFQTGLTPNYLRVLIPSTTDLRGTVHNVTLEGMHDPQTLSGQIAQD